MAIDPKHLGRKYGPTRYTVGLEKAREFSFAVGGGVPNAGFGEGAPPGLHPYLHDEAAGKAGPYGSVIAFPTFPVTFAMAPFWAAVTDPEVGVNLLLLVHGEQELELFDVLRPGDELTTTGYISQILDKGGKDFLTVISESTDAAGRLRVRGTWTAVIRR